jgi:dipeptide/tripeptide permease
VGADVETGVVDAVQFCERLAYYGLSGSLPIFFHKNLGMSTVLATELNSLFTSLSYLTPLLGAYVADRHLGRFTTYVFGEETDLCEG